MKIAVITGASSGLGKEFAVAVDRMRPEIDELWLIARRKDRLSELASGLQKKCRIFPFDISEEEWLSVYRDELRQNGAEIVLLINNAGFGRLGRFDTLLPEDNGGMVRLNCEALTYMVAASLPFMKERAEIINTCSIAAFAPNTRMAVYCSTKAYVMSLSRALRAELKARKINVLACCPGPMDTEFLSLAGIETGVSKTFDRLPRVNPRVMAEKTLTASRRKKAVYTNRLFFKFYRVLAKLLPHTIVMKMSGA